MLHTCHHRIVRLSLLFATEHMPECAKPCLFWRRLLPPFATLLPTPRLWDSEGKLSLLLPNSTCLRLPSLGPSDNAHRRAFRLPTSLETRADTKVLCTKGKALREYRRAFQEKERFVLNRAITLARGESLPTSWRACQKRAAPMNLARASLRFRQKTLAPNQRHSSSHQRR